MEVTNESEIRRWKQVLYWIILYPVTISSALGCDRSPSLSTTWKIAMAKKIVWHDISNEPDPSPRGGDISDDLLRTAPELSVTAFMVLRAFDRYTKGEVLTPNHTLYWNSKDEDWEVVLDDGVNHELVAIIKYLGLNDNERGFKFRISTLTPYWKHVQEEWRWQPADIVVPYIRVIDTYGGEHDIQKE